MCYIYVDLSNFENNVKTMKISQIMSNMPFARNLKKKKKKKTNTYVHRSKRNKWPKKAK